jgi:hypothetical protein
LSNQDDWPVKEDRHFCGGREFYCVKDIIVASLKGAILFGSAANDLFLELS